MHSKKFCSRKISRNRSALGNMTNIQREFISRIDSLSLLSESLWSCPSSLKVWVCVSRRLRSSSTLVTLRACTDQLSRNFTNILQLIEEFQRIISRFGTNWTHHKSKSWPKSRKHLNFLATFYLEYSALCSVVMVWEVLKEKGLLDYNKPAAQAAGQTLPDATHPTGWFCLASVDM